MFAGHYIFQCIKAGKYRGSEYATKGGVNFLYGKASNLWHGEPGLTLERWEFWKVRFWYIHGLEEVLAETREIALVAATRMEEIESLAS